MAAGKDRRLRAIKRRVEASAAKLADLEGGRGRVGVLDIPDGMDLTTPKGKAWLAVNLKGAPCVALPGRLTEGQWLERYAQRSH